MRVVYHWANGVYVNTLDNEFDKHYRELCGQYGYPVIARVLDDDDWMKKPLICS
jgi:hypothetical protein